MPKKELNDPWIKGLKPPTKKRDKQYSDTIVPGLRLRVTENGTKSFAFQYRINGKSKRYTIGKYPTLKLAEARRVAREIAETVSKGIDPQAEKVERRDDLTVKELAEKFKEQHLPDLKKSTQTDYKERLNNVIIPALGNYIAKDIEADDILDLLEDIADRAPIQSNRVRAILSSMYTYGQKRRYVKINPVLIIPRLGKENQRERFFTENEIRKIWAIIDDLDNPVRSLLKLLFITGQRLGETRQMKWSQIEYKKRIEVVDKDNPQKTKTILVDLWTIPKELTKAKREHKLPLSPMAVDLLDQLKVITGGSEYVFQSPLIDDQPITWIQWHARSIRDLGKVENENGEKIGVDDFRIHDIRRTVTSYMAQLQIDRTVLGKVLNHKQMAGDNHVTASYDRYDYMPEKKKALHQWSNKLKSIITEKDVRATGSDNSGATIHRLY